SDGNRFDHQVGVRVDTRQHIGLGTGDPNSSLSERDGERTSRNLNLGDNAVRSRIDSRESSLLIGYKPDAAGASGQSAFRVADSNRDGGGYFSFFEIDSGKRVIAAEWDP